MAESEAAAKLAEAAIEGVRTVRTVAEGIVGTTGKGVEGVTETSKRVAEGTTSTVRKAVEGVTETVKRIGEGVTETTQRVAEGVTAVEVPTKVQAGIGVISDKRDQSTDADKSDHSNTEISGKADKSRQSDNVVRERGDVNEHG